MSETVEAFLIPYTLEVKDLALKVRRLILDVIPEAIEQVDTPAKSIGYGYDRTYTGSICAIAPQKSYINLMFGRGTELADPEGLLEGTGKKARHIKIRTPEAVDNPAVRALLEAAITATKKGMEQKKSKR